MKSQMPSLWHEKNQGMEPFGSLQREIDRLFDQFSRGVLAPMAGFSGDGSGALTPRIDVSETDKTIEVTAELPGVEEKDVEVTLVENTLTIKGETREEQTSENERFHLRERRFGSFVRSIALPNSVDAEKIEAVNENGVLTLTLPKAEAVKPKRIEVKKMIESK